MKQTITFFLALTYLACTSVLQADNRATETETFEKTVSFQPGGQLKVENVNGNITIETWDKQEIRIYATKTAHADDKKSAHEILEATKIEITSTPDRIHVRTHHPKNEILLQDDSITVTYTITTPAQINLDLESVNGNIDTRGTNGPIRAETINGSLDIQNMQDGLRAETVNGSIHISVADQTNSDIHIKTINGGIELTLPEHFKGQLKTHTLNGKLQVDRPITIQGKISKRRIEGSLNGGTSPTIQLSTVNGSIKILK